MVFKNMFDGQLPRGSRHHSLCAGWRHRARPRFFQRGYIIMIA